MSINTIDEFCEKSKQLANLARELNICLSVAYVLNDNDTLTYEIVGGKNQLHMMLEKLQEILHFATKGEVKCL